MTALVKIDGLIVLSIFDEPREFFGIWKNIVKNGEAAWVPLPANEVFSDLDLVAGPGFVVNQARKSARIGLKQQVDAVIARIEAYDEDAASAAERKQFQKDIRSIIQRNKLLLAGGG